MSSNLFTDPDETGAAKRRPEGGWPLPDGSENVALIPSEGNPMDSRTLVIVTLAGLSAACSSQPVSRPEFDEAALAEEVLETLDGLTQAMSSGDPDRVFGFYRQDERFFYMGCTSSMAGWSTFAPRVASYYRTSRELTFQREVLSAQILSATTAVVAMRGSSTEAEALFWTEVLQKGEDGRWLVTYEHESWPGCSVPSGPHIGTEGGEDVGPASPRRE